MNPIYVDAGKLDINQRGIYNLKLDAKFIVKGCAGSGKTSLALLRMKQLLASESAEGETPFYYVAFVRELVECMRKEIDGLPDIETQFNDYAITYENWQNGEITDWVRSEYGINARESMRVETKKHGRFRDFTNISIRVNKRPDYLFVDECQDLEIDAIESFVRGAQKGIGFYGDDDQHIMAWRGRCPVTLKTIHDRFNLPVHDLIFNYRLPKEIAMFAEQIGGRSDLSRHCKSPFHEKPFVISVKDREEANAFIMKRISNLGLQDVGIAYTENEQVRAAYQSLATGLGRSKVSASWNINGVDPLEARREGEHWSHLTDTPVKIMTYEKIKGQQFETVFLFVSGELNPEMVKRFYVGVTRAERFLYILHTEPMPAVLRQVPSQFYSTSDDAGNFTDLYQGAARVKTQNENLDEMVGGNHEIDIGF